MAGLLAMGLGGMSMPGMAPADVMNDPYMSESNPIMDALIAHFMKTDKATRKPMGMKKQGTIEPLVKKKSESGAKMRETKGPIKARTAHRIAERRDRLTSQIP